ncbi:hypothetical protein Tsubulata_039533 [Turnera subulata]|uniref:F-box domain-containing protein n=1 Tax=Turnera subulata TaxID=218843 RepID=A0A9Q0G379_9ROSI|nr:hypothetical protein Tsubulata_039533 [Turnera subulata]
MDVHCWSLIPYMWQKLLAVLHLKVEVASLPDDVIIDILSRLPADQLLECRRVCKGWRALTKTNSFAELQLKRATPVILAGCFDFSNPHCIYLNDAPEGLLQPIRRFLNSPLALYEEEPNPPHQIVELNCWLLSSCDGLILGIRQIPRQLFIYNPITQEEITFPEVFNKVHICGLYFHPLTKEYRIIYAFATDNNNNYQYVIVNLPTFSWRALDYRFYCRPPTAKTTTLASGNLHWMVEHCKEAIGVGTKTRKDDQPCANSILRFNILTEYLDTVPHPEHDSCSGPTCGEMQLFEVDGNLSLCNRRGYSVFLWTLVDYSSWRWIRRYRFSLATDLQFSRFTLDYSCFQCWFLLSYCGAGSSVLEPVITKFTDRQLTYIMVVPRLWRKLFACSYSKADVASALPLPDDVIIDIFFPDDVIIDILSRLPADQVLQCRRVCKRWRALTSTASFAELQLKRATPVILAGCLDDSSSYPYCIFVNDAQQQGPLPTNPPQQRLLLANTPPHEMAEINCWVLSSCDGLILGKRKIPSQVFIYNPITQDEITFPEAFNAYHICGVYFHPVTKEYRVLYVFGRDQFNYYQFFIANLPTFSERPLSQGFNCCPPSAEATLAGGNLYWMLEHRKDVRGNPIAANSILRFDEPCANSILRFDIHTENLSTVPHPEWESCTGPSYGEMQLLQVDERLSLGHKRGHSLFLWTLEDYPNWHWIRRYKLNLADLYGPHIIRNHRMSFLWIKTDELLISWGVARLISWRLQS